MKKVIITGASSGLGLELAKLFIQNNYQVINISRTKPKDINIEHIPTDLTSEKDIAQCIQKIQEAHNDFICLIHNAGDGKVEDIASIDFKNVNKTFQLNSIAPIMLTSGLMQNIKKNNADIIVIGATIGFKSNLNFTSYSAAKRALRGYIENLQTELKKTPSRVIGIHPGGMDTPGNTGPQGRVKQIEKLTNTTDTSTYMNPKTIAQLVFDIYQLPKSIEVSEIIINRK